MQRRIIPIIAIAGLLVTACSGGSDDGGAVEVEDSNEVTTEVDTGDADTTDTDTADTDTGNASDSSLVDDLPQFLSEFDRVCTTETGFGGATPYDATAPGPHPFVLMQESDSGSIFERDLSDAPAGWNIQTDSDFDDNSEIAPTELIACAQRVSTTATGIMCDLEDDDGNVTTLELVDVTLELTVREATTGTAIGTETIEAVDTDCPFFVFIDEGENQYFNDPTEDQYINAMKPYVMP